MKKLFSFIFVFLSFNALSIAQEHKHEHTVPCGLDAVSQQLYDQNPEEYLAAQAYSRQQIKEWIAANKDNLQKKAELITIPIVFHVVWSSNNPNSNISDEQIYSQVEALNRDFRAQNDLSIVRDIFKDRIADMEIEFRLAEFDPEGNLTTGITRTETDVEVWSIEDASAMKYDENGGKDPWPSSDYLNIWVISRLQDQDGGNGIAGYAQPGGNFPSNSRIDGVVIRHSFLGQTGTADLSDFGRTGTHEVGHWLSLHHLWGAFNSGEETPSCLGEDDEVSDTPFTLDANFGCNFNRNQCTQENPDFPDMIENYMDYANSSCQGLFTNGQKDRARAILNTTRSQITTSTGLKTVRGENDVMIVDVLNPTSGDKSCLTVEPVIEVANFGTSDLFYFEVDYTINGESYDYQWIGTDGGLAPWNSLNNSPKKVTITLPEITLSGVEGNYTMEVVVSRPNGSLSEFDESDNTISVDFQTVSPGAEPYFEEAFDFVVFPPIGWSVFNQDNNLKGRFKQTSDIGVGDSKAALMENFEYNALGETDELILPPLDFTGDLGKISMNFQYAYAYIDDNSTSDTLSVMISDDCGSNFVTVAQLYGEDLYTAAPTSEFFVPTEGEWRSAQVDLSSFINTTNHIIVKLSQTRGTGNNLYIDAMDLLSESTDIPSVITQSSLKIFPNPANQMVRLQFGAQEAAHVQVDVLDKAGRRISGQNIAAKGGLNQHEISLENLPAGVYFVKIQDGSQVTTKKLLVF